MARTGSAALAKMSPAARIRALAENEYELPQKSVQPVSRGLSMGAPAAAVAAPTVAPVAGAMSLDQLLKRNIASGQILDPLTKAAGVSGWEYMPDAMNESGEAIGTGVADRQALLASPLAGYSFDWKDTGPANTGTLTAFDSTGKQAGAYQQQDRSSSDVFKEYLGMGAGLLAGPLGLGASLGGALGLSGTLGSVVGGGLIGGGTAAVTGQNIGKGLLMGGLGGAVSGYFGAPTGATAGADAIGNGAFLGEGVASGIPAWDNAGSLLDGIPGITSNPAAALDAYSAANPVTMADIAKTLPQIDLTQMVAPSLGSYDPASYYADMPQPMPPANMQAPAAPEIGNGAFLGEGVPSGVPSWDAAAGMPAISAPIISPTDQIRFLEANGMTNADIVASMPDLAQAGGLTGVTGAPAVLSQQVAPKEFRPSTDSQQYNADNGITQPVGTTPPKTVNMGAFDNPAYTGGTMATAGGLQGLLDVAKQNASDMMTRPNAITGGGGTVGGALDWLKQNPAWGRLLLGGATSLLSGAGGGSGSSGSTAPSGPPVSWNSGLQQGFLSPVQQYAPPAIQQQRPAGLLAQGYQNDGAWRYLKG